MNERDREREEEEERDGEEGRESEGVEREGENSWLLMFSHPHRITSRRDRQTSKDRRIKRKTNKRFNSIFLSAVRRIINIYVARTWATPGKASHSTFFDLSTISALYFISS